MRRSVFVRVVLAGAVVGASVVGISAVVGATKPGPPQIPALSVSVGNACTGANVPNATVTVRDPTTGDVLSPSSTKHRLFTFTSIDAPKFDVFVVGGTFMHELGHNLSLPHGVGRIDLSGGPTVTEGLRVVVLLMPIKGCAAPRQATIPALSATVLDSTTLAPVAAPSANIVADPGTPDTPTPPPPDIGVGTVGESALAPGVYDLTVGGAGYPNGTVPVVIPGGSPSSGSIAVGVIAQFLAPPLSDDPAPVITSISASSNLLSEGDTDSLGAMVSDPVPDGTLTYAWTVSGSTSPSCSFDSPAALQANLSCSQPGPVVVTFTVTDPDGPSAAQSFTIDVEHTASDPGLIPMMWP